MQLNFSNTAFENCGSMSLSHKEMNLYFYTIYISMQQDSYFQYPHYVRIMKEDIAASRKFVSLRMERPCRLYIPLFNTYETWYYPQPYLVSAFYPPHIPNRISSILIFLNSTPAIHCVCRSIERALFLLHPYMPVDIVSI